MENRAIIVSGRRPNNKNKQKPKNKKKRAQKRRIAKAGYVSAPPNFYLSNCAQLYLHALVNPFTPLPTSELPCIPDFITLPSNKVQVSVRGTMTLGTEGFGYVLLDPFAMINNENSTVGANTDYPLLYTTSAFVNANVNYLPAAGSLPVGVVAAASNTPYSSAAQPLSTGDVRLVGCGLRVRYSGSELYRGGSATLYRSQGNQSVPNGVSIATLLTSQLAVQAPIKRQWIQVNYSPDAASQVDYQNFGTTFDSLGTGVSHFSLLIAIQAPVLSGGLSQQTYDFEANAYFEVLGQNVPLTPSHCDPVGTGAIRTALSVARLSTAPPEQQERGMLQQIMSTAWETMSGVASSVGQAALQFAGNKAIQAIGRAAVRAAPLALAAI